MGLRNRLGELYDRLPRVKCQGKCQEACGPIACSKGEAKIMERRAGRPLLFSSKTGRCTYLNDDGKCDVYRDRPFVCRAFGASATLPCIWGCQPDRVISKDEQFELFRQILELGGGLYGPYPDEWTDFEQRHRWEFERTLEYGPYLAKMKGTK